MPWTYDVNDLGGEEMFETFEKVMRKKQLNMREVEGTR